MRRSQANDRDSPVLQRADQGVDDTPQVGLIRSATRALHRVRLNREGARQTDGKSEVTLTFVQSVADTDNFYFVSNDRFDSR